MSTPHPSYPFPTVREVVCEIHFRLLEKWDRSLYSAYFNQVQQEFSTFQPVPISLQLASNRGGSTSITVPQVMRYQHQEKNVFIQLSENKIAVNALYPYPGWQQVRKDIVYAWEKFEQVASPIKVSRIGIRYINSIERGSEFEALSRWLHATRYIPEAILSSSPDFVSQISIHIDASNTMQVIVSDQPPNDTSYGNFVLDIDRVVEEEIDADIEFVLNRADVLHNDVWEVFYGAQTIEFANLLRGELI